MIEDPFDCALYPTIQQIAAQIQAGKVGPRAATISGGRIYTDATLLELYVLCIPPPG